MAHINSTPRKSLNGRTPYEMFKYLFGAKTLDKLGVKKIEIGINSALQTELKSKKK